ncbi:hypothetical protein HLB03_09055, partial [Acidianus sp. DSM 29099]|nr:hypothetical protein [Acidianus sp. RZ1]
MATSTCPNFIDLLDYLKERLKIEDERVIFQSLDIKEVEKVEKSDFKNVLALFRKTYENVVNVNKRVYEIAEKYCKDIYEKLCLENKGACKEVIQWCSKMRRKTWEEVDRELLSKLTSDKKEIKSIHDTLKDMYDFASKYAHGEIEVIGKCCYLIKNFKNAIYF